MNRFLQIGIDFGTTNTVIALRDAAGAVTTVRYGTDDTYRSILYFDTEEDAAGQKLLSWAGAQALDEYIATGEHGRLLQSLKSYLASPHFTHSNIFGTSFALENLIARFLQHALRDGELGNTANARLCVGRPVRFVAQDSDPQLALTRLQQAFTQAGMPHITFIEEPVAAAYAYATRLTEPKNVLIADLGGGTSDFSVLRVVRPGVHPQLDILATGGVGVAGDDCDAAIIRHVVAPQFGFEQPLKNGQLPPRWLYDNLARWHYLSFLRSPANMKVLQDLVRQAVNPEPFIAFATLVDGNGGFALARAVQATKAALSSADVADFIFAFDDSVLSARVTRAEFEAWITPVRDALATALDETMQKAGLAASAIDHVFMTGGTSYIPFIRDIFASRFGVEKLADGGEFTSVAGGLALAA